MVGARFAIDGYSRDTEYGGGDFCPGVAVSEATSIFDAKTSARSASLAVTAGALAMLYVALAAGTGGAFELRLHTLLGIVLAVTLIALSVIDLRTFRLPDALTLPLAAAGIASAWWLEDELVWRAFSAIAGYLALRALIEGYRLLRGVDGMGLGDAKLLAAAGAWLGAENLPMTVLVACCSALVVAGAYALASDAAARHAVWSRRMPFGPHIALGIWIVWLYGPLL